MKSIKSQAINIVCALLFLLLAVSGCSSHSSEDATRENLQRILASEWQAFSAGKPNFGGGLALQVLSPKGDYFLSTGMGEGMGPDYRFRTASVTKTFTAAAIMLLTERGRLDIDDLVTDAIPGQDRPYVPDTPSYDIPNKGEMTIRMVLMHRAGIFDLSNQDVQENDATRDEPYVNRNYLEYVMALDPDHQFTFDEMFDVIARGKQAQFSPPGLKYQYSDTGYCLLALIVERVSGKAYGDFVREELLVPNDLRETSLPWQGLDNTLPAPFVPGFKWHNATLADVTVSNMSAFVGNGNMITTPGNLASWCRRLFSGRAGLRMDTVETMMDGLPTSEDSANTYGLGIHFMENQGYGHSGAHEGYLSLMFHRPEIDTSYVMVSNVWDCRTCTENLDSIKAQLGMMTDTVNKILDELEG